jgi:hypothetical protein
MRKLELKDIVGYLPYKMLFEYKGNILRMDTIQRFGYNVWAQQKYYKSKKNVKDINYSFLSKSNCSGYGFYIKGIKPILHPMSDLTKPITVDDYNNGKDFVPLFELAKTAYKEVYDKCILIKNVASEISSNPKANDIYEVGNFSLKDGMFEVIEYGEVIKRNKKDSEPFVEIVHIPLKQCSYYDLLNQWHFDYRGLIDAGLAVDINTVNL